MAQSEQEQSAPPFQEVPEASPALSANLMEAIEEGDLEAVTRLLDAGADPNSRDGMRSTALMQAVLGSHVEIVRLLLEQGADVSLVDDVGGNAYRHAVRLGRSDMVQQLEQAGATPTVPERKVSRQVPVRKIVSRFTKVSIAITLLFVVIGFSWLRQLYKQHLTDFLMEAINRHDDAAATDLISSATLDPDRLNEQGLTPLMMAAYQDRPDVVHALLLRHVDPNLQDPVKNTALHWAWINHVDMAIMQDLLEHGADANREDRLGRTVLAYASRSQSYPDLVQLLLKHGAKPNVRDRMPPLISAIVTGDKGDTALTLALLEHGADPNVHSWNGISALGWAVDQNNPEIVSALLAHHARVNAPDLHLRTPLMVAVTDGNAGMVKILLQHGADPNYKDRKKQTPLKIALLKNVSKPEVATALRAAGAHE